MNDRDRILEEVHELVYQRGIKGLTMDDIARKLGISKKTLYQAFRTKSDLACALIALRLNYYRSQINEQCENASNALDEIFRMMAVYTQMLKNSNPAFIHEIRKYYPEAWELFLEFKNGFLLKAIQENLRRGKGEGIYRRELKVKIVAIFRMEMIDLCLNPIIFPPEKFELQDVLQEVGKNYAVGISTIKGHKLFNQIMKDRLASTEALV